MKSIVVFSLLCLIGLACKENPVTETKSPPPLQPPPNAHAVYVLNEGSYGDPAGARLTMYDIDGDSVYQSVYEASNSGLHLGSTGDDMRLVKGFLFILMSGSQNLEIVRESSHRQLQEYYFTQIPHDIVVDTLRSKAFITQLYNNALYVLNTGTLQLQDSITVGKNPQGLLINGSNLYVCNSGFGADSTVSVIDIEGDSVVTTIPVGVGPVSIAQLWNGKIAVACTGDSVTKARIAIINPATNTLVDTILFSENLFYQTGIAASLSGYVYVIGSVFGDYYGGPVHRIKLDTKEITMNYIPGSYYSITLDAATNEIYLTDVKNFSANGNVLIYKEDGTLRKFFEAEKGPASIVFKR